MTRGPVRSRRSRTRQVAALPWRVDADGAIRILMITSRETRRWVIPKGGRMAGKTDAEAAAQEAIEEAGVFGAVTSGAIGRFRYRKSIASAPDRLCVVSVFPLRVSVQAGDWREAHERERRWMSVEDAARAVHEPDLAALILDFGRRVTSD